MNSTFYQHTQHILAISALLSVLAFPFLTLAQETGGASLDTSLDAVVEITSDIPTPPLTPLKKLRQEAAKIQETRQELRNRAVEVREGIINDTKTMRSDVRLQMRGATSSESRKVIQEEARQKNQEFRAMRVEARTQFKTDLGVRIVQYKESVIVTLSSAIDRMNDLTARIESRIAKIKEKGGSVTEAEASLGVAVSAIAQAVVDIEAADAHVVASVDGDAPSNEKKKSVREAVQKAAKSVRTAHTALKKAFEETRKAAQTVPPQAKIEAGVNTTIE